MRLQKVDFINCYFSEKTPEQFRISSLLSVHVMCICKYMYDTADNRLLL